MESILAVDFGLTRIGVALADKSVQIALPLGIFDRKTAEKRILSLIKDRNVSTVVFGMPLNDDDTEGGLCRQIRSFAKRISKRANVSICLVDEYGSSDEAAGLLHNVRNASARIDDGSAAVILERYLERLRSGTKRT